MKTKEKKKSRIFRMISNNVFMLRYIDRFCRSHIYITLFSALFGSISSVFNLMVSRYIINSITAAGQTGKSRLPAVCLLIMGAGLYQLAALWLNQYIQQTVLPKNTQIIYQKMQMELFQKAAKVELSCYEDSEFYNRFSIAMQQADSRALAVLNTLNSFLTGIFGIGALSALVVGLDPVLIFFVLGNVLISFQLNLNIIKKQHAYMLERMPHYRRTEYTKRIFYLQNYAKELRLFPDFSDLMKDKYNETMGILQKLIKKNGKKFASLYGLQGSVGIFTNVLTLLYLAFRVVTGRLLIGDFVVLTGSVQQLSASITNFLGTIPQLYEHSIYIENFKEFIEIESFSERSDYKQGPVLELHTEQVSFVYPKTEKEVLKNINFVVRQGERIALVGRNGAGKSTLIKLLAKLYKPTNGCIRINGIDNSNISTSDLCEEIGIIFQDYQIFAVSVVENVLMRKVKSQKDLTLVEDALKFAGLWEKIVSFPKGIYSTLTREFGNDGIFLSGGEMQKLAIARVYAGNYSLLILDEPSSSLDPISEKHMFDQTRYLAKGKCTIMISHRLTNIQDADRIYVLDEGKIVEVGSHEKLMEQKGTYFEMYQTQNKME